MFFDNPFYSDIKNQHSPIPQNLFIFLYCKKSLFLTVSRKPLPPVPGDESSGSTVSLLIRSVWICSEPMLHHMIYVLMSLMSLIGVFCHKARRPPPPPPQEAQEEAGPQEEVVIALYDFEGLETHDLTLKKGEEYVILEKCDVNWYKARDKHGCVWCGEPTIMWPPLGSQTRNYDLFCVHFCAENPLHNLMFGSKITFWITCKSLIILSYNQILNLTFLSACFLLISTGFIFLFGVDIASIMVVLQRGGLHPKQLCDWKRIRHTGAVHVSHIRH